MVARKAKKAVAVSVAQTAYALEDPTSIGNVLRKLGKITQEQLLTAVGQKAHFDEALLGALLKQMGYIKDADIALALKIQGELRAGARVTAELDVLQSKMDEAARGADELRTKIVHLRHRRQPSVSHAQCVPLSAVVAH